MKVFFPLPVLLLFGSICSSKAADILFLVSTAKHNNPAWSMSLIDALVANGHNLVVVSTAPNPEPKKQVDGLLYYHLPNEYDVMRKHFISQDTRKYQKMMTLKQLLVWYEVLLGSCSTLLKSNTMNSKVVELAAQLSMDFELIITDVTQGVECLMDMYPLWRSKPILGLSAGKLSPDLISMLQAENTISASRIPHHISQFPKGMSYLDRLYNHIMYYAEPLIRFQIVRPVLKGLLKQENGYPTLQLVLLNTHPSLDYVQNLPPGVIEVGGLHIKREVSPLPTYIQEFTQKFIDGIVYINIPYVEYMNGQGVQAVFKMILNNPNCGFIWNVQDMDLVPEEKPNLLTLHVDQSLQQDILALNYVKGFLNHGDSFSLQEAVHNGVPVVVLPLKLEEFNNAQRVKERNLGVVIQASDFDQKSLADALKRILNDERFTSAIYQAQVRFRNRPQSPLELAVWHVEKLIAEPRLFNNFAQTEALAQNFFVAHSLDVLLPPLVILLFVVVNGSFLVLIFFQSGKNPTKEKKPKAESSKKRKKEKKESMNSEPKNITLMNDSTLIEDLNEEILEGEEQLLMEDKKRLKVKKDD
ncbi:UDP-glucosyltransferase 2 [Drosophila eugracilis]|uniref:UDP-glucosyltransferase 2 n=1 Tax=Drosophila eugracilis TaxID=29029 RepID=UPI0007E7E703|nr:UDP-glucosyltransferase 2 [Drosophila eugracilis]